MPFLLALMHAGTVGTGRPDPRATTARDGGEAVFDALC
jgi:hypothetical protein